MTLLLVTCAGCESRSHNGYSRVELDPLRIVSLRVHVVNILSPTWVIRQSKGGSNAEGTWPHSTTGANGQCLRKSRALRKGVSVSSECNTRHTDVESTLERLTDQYPELSVFLSQW